MEPIKISERITGMSASEDPKVLRCKAELTEYLQIEIHEQNLMFGPYEGLDVVKYIFDQSVVFFEGYPIGDWQKYFMELCWYWVVDYFEYRTECFWLAIRNSRFRTYVRETLEDSFWSKKPDQFPTNF
jgi:hypothetical protein